MICELTPEQSKKAGNVDEWKKFINKFFSEDGLFRQVVRENVNDKGKQFEITCATLPRYFHRHHESGVESMQVTLDGLGDVRSVNQSTYLDCSRAKFIYWFKNSTQVSRRAKSYGTSS